MPLHSPTVQHHSEWSWWGTQSHLFKLGKEKRSRKKMVMMLFYSAGLGLLAVQWRWWKVRRHQMGWYTFIFRNEINHHHSYNQKHTPATSLKITSGNCLKTPRQLPDNLTAWWQPRYCQRCAMQQKFRASATDLMTQTMQKSPTKMKLGCGSTLVEIM